jgi:hypothetical protein
MVGKLRRVGGNKVSILLNTVHRARFLPGALDAEILFQISVKTTWIV